MNHSYALIAAYSLLFVVGCSPVPLLQSPRIKSGLSSNVAIKNSGVGIGNVNYAEENIKTKERFVTDELLPFSLAYGIKKRVEISGMIYPYLYYGFLWTGNSKVNIVDIGKGNFNNVASAVFTGTTGYFGEHEKVSNYYGGVSIGSMINLLESELEIVFQISFSKEYKKSYEDLNTYWIHWLQPAAGIVINPLKNDLLCLCAGINYSHPMQSTVMYHSYLYNEDRTVINSARGGITFLGEIRLHLKF